MPFKSDKQRRYMFAREPEIAKRWAEEEKKGKKRKPAKMKNIPKGEWR